jgi:hypothetical protein
MAAAQMQPYEDNIVMFQMLLRGFTGARDRFHGAKTDRDPGPAFAALFEALNWAVALDDRVRAHWAPDGEVLNWGWRKRVANALMLDGVRWARNNVHHQWSDALVVREGMSYPKTFPMVFWEWVWRPASEFPASDRSDERGATVYREHLEGVPARLTLMTLDEIFGLLAKLLEPTSWNHDRTPEMD